MSKRKALKEISYLWLGSILGAIAAFITQVLLARKLGLNDFGLFSSALSIVTLLTPLAGFGVSQFWLKAFGKEGVYAARWLNGSYQFVIASTVFVILSIITWALLGPNEPITRTILLLISVYVLGQVLIELVSSKFQLEEKYFHLAVWQFSPHALRLIALLLVILFSATNLDLVNVSLIYSLIAIVFFILGFKLVTQIKGNKFELKGHFNVEKDNRIEKKNHKLMPSAKEVFFNSWPFGLAAFFHLIYYQSDIILLKYLNSNEAAGVYNVAFTVMAAVYLLPGVIYQKYLLPKLHRWANHDRAKFYEVYRKGSKIMLALGVFAMLGIWLTSFWGIPLLFGDKFKGAIVSLNILAVSAPIIFLAFNLGATLVTKENMRRKVKYMAYVAIINVILNLLLIPSFGGVGAAVATVLSNLCLLLFYSSGVRKFVFS